MLLGLSPASADAQVKCLTVVAPVMPQAAIDKGIEGQVKARASLKGGVVTDVTILSGPPIFHDAVREAMMRYKCTSNAAEASVVQEFNFRSPPADQQLPPVQATYANRLETKVPATDPVRVDTSTNSGQNSKSSAVQLSQQDIADLALAKALADIKQERGSENRQSSNSSLVRLSQREAADLALAKALADIKQERGSEVLHGPTQQQQHDRERSGLRKEKCLEAANSKNCAWGCVDTNSRFIRLVPECMQSCEAGKRANAAACEGIYIPYTPPPQQIIIQQAPMQMPNPAACIQDGGSTMCLGR